MASPYHFRPLEDRCSTELPTVDFFASAYPQSPYKNIKPSKGAKQGDQIQRTQSSLKVPDNSKTEITRVSSQMITEEEQKGAKTVVEGLMD